MTFASKISIARIALVPVFGALALMYGHSVKSGQPDESWRLWALAVFITAAASDGLDGWIARRFNQISDFGKTIDPIADKALLLTGVIVLTCVNWGRDGWALPWWLAAVVILRDCFILGGIRILRSQGCLVKIQPHWIGKVCTVSQMIALGWVMLKWVDWSPVIPSLVAAITTVASGIIYYQQGRKIQLESISGKGT